MMSILKLIRFKNLIIIALVQILIKYALLVPFYTDYGVVTFLNPFEFTVLILATICIAAAGYVINAIYSIETNLINQPETVIVSKTLSETKAYNLFMIFNVIGVTAGFYLAYAINKPSLFVLFFAASALLYIYATALKQMPFIGNLVLAVVVALGLLIVGIFELFPAMTPGNKSNQILFFRIIVDYTLFVFGLTLIRAIVKDIEAVNGDYKLGMQTLPILFGRQRATLIAFVLTLLLILGVTAYVVHFFFEQLFLLIYFLILVIGPLIYVSIKLYQAETAKEHRKINTYLKYILLAGLMSMLLYQFVLL